MQLFRKKKYDKEKDINYSQHSTTQFLYGINNKVLNIFIYY